MTRAPGRVDRILLVVLDGLGIGALGRGPAHLRGAHSLRNATARAHPPWLPFLSSLGLLAAAGDTACPPGRSCGWGRSRQLSRFNESYAAHWEMAGYIAGRGHGHRGGLSGEMLGWLESALGTPVVGNLGLYPRLDRVPAGVVDAHLATGRPILLVQGEEEPVSVLALYGHAAVLPPDRLFAMVTAAAPTLAGAPVPGRVCARAFDLHGDRPSTRPERLDLPYFTPPSTELFDAITQSGREVRATGKVGGLFSNQGFTDVNNEWGDNEIRSSTLAALAATAHGLVWANFNTLTRPAGAGQDCLGWVQALERYDGYLAELHAELGSNDVLIVTGDHGVDPSLTGEHTFEWTPLLIATEHAHGVPIGSRHHADIAATIADWWELPPIGPGDSFAGKLVSENE